MGVVLAPALGPSLGGLLVDAFGWRSIFFMVVPLCLASLWLGRLFVPVTAPGGVAARRDVSIDWVGLLLASVGTVCLLNGLVQWQGDTVALAATLLAGFVLCLAAFVAWQHRLRHGRSRNKVEPLMNLSLFQHRPFAMGSLVAFIYGTALFGSTYLIPVYLQMGLGLSASYVGALLLPDGLVLAATIAIVGKLADRQPAHWLVSTGLLLLALSFALVVLLDRSTPLAWLVALTILGRIGLGFVLPSLNLGSMRGVARDHIAQGASAINFLRMLGGAAGVSLCGMVLEWRLAAHGVSLSNTAGAEARLAAFNETFIMLGAICALALWAAWNLRPRLATSREEPHHPS
jgi:predicted MFS family arabinose efflux permease